MSNGSFGREDFKIVAARIGLVPEEMYLVVCLEKTKAKRLVPSGGEHVEADLPADRVRKVVLSERLLEHVDHLGPNIGLLVVPFKLVSFFLAAIPADRRNVQHPVSELDEGTPLDGNVQIGDVMQHEIDEGFELLFSEIRLQTLGGQQVTRFVSHESVFRKHEIVLVDCTIAQLFRDLGEIRSTDDPYVYRLASQRFHRPQRKPES